MPILGEEEEAIAAPPMSAPTATVATAMVLSAPDLLHMYHRKWLKNMYIHSYRHAHSNRRYVWISPCRCRPRSAGKTDAVPGDANCW